MLVASVDSVDVYQQDAAKAAARGVDARGRGTRTAYGVRRRMRVRERPTTSKRTLASATSGHEVAVFGSVRADEDGAADADWVVADDDCAGFAVDDCGAAAGLAAGLAVEEALAAEAGGAPPAVAAAVGTLARTSCSVITRGGAEVMNVALS